MALRSRKVVQLGGCAQDGHQMLVTHTEKVEQEKNKEAVGLVSLVVCELDAQQLAEAFNKQFLWGTMWSASSYGPN